MADFTGNQIRHTYQRLLQLDSFIVQNGTGSIALSHVNLSGSVHVTGSQTITGNLNVDGDVRARQFIATTVSSSIIYESGSSAFGNSLDDTHTFTGSVSTTGSYTAHGTHTITGSIAHVGSATQTGDLVRNGNTTVTGSLSHSGSAIAEGTYEVKEGVYGAFFANPQTINKNVTIPASYNSRIYGPITIAAGKTLTVGANAKLEITDI